MIKYILLICVSVLLLHLQRSKRLGWRVIAIILIVFAVFSAKGSWDYPGYQYYYNCSLSGVCGENYVETSYKYISKLADKLFNESGFLAVLLFYCSISIYIKIKFISRNSAWFGASVFAYICYGYFIHDMTQIRASLAVALFWLSLERLEKKDTLNYWLYIFLASLVHTSAIIGAAAFIYSRFKSKALLLSLPVAMLFGWAINFLEIPSFINCDFCGRTGIYLKAYGVGTLDSPQMTIYLLFILLISIASTYLVVNHSFIEDVAVKSAIFGGAVYLLLYSIPVISMRSLEFYSSLYPLIVASIFKTPESIRWRLFVVACCLVVFGNLALRNNTRVDLVMNHHVLRKSQMTELQFKHYLTTNGKEARWVDD